MILFDAERITGLCEKAALVREGVRAVIERDSARRLAKLWTKDKVLAAIAVAGLALRPCLPAQTGPLPVGPACGWASSPSNTQTHPAQSPAPRPGLDTSPHR